jgi:hypothetical protein
MAVVPVAQTLEQDIRALPATLRAALERELRATRRIAQLEEEIKTAQAAQRELDDGWGERMSVSRLRMQVQDAEAPAELRFREQRDQRPTQGHLWAVVRAHPKVVRLREGLVAAEVAEHQRRGGARDAEVAKPPSARLAALEVQLAEVQAVRDQAEIDVEVARATLETYKMLVALAAAGSVDQ